MPSLYDLKSFLEKKKNFSLKGKDFSLYESILFSATEQEEENPKFSILSIELDFIPSENLCTELENDGFHIEKNTSTSCKVTWKRFLTVVE